MEVFGAFGLTVSEKKTVTLLMRTLEKAQQPGETPTPPLPALEIAAAGQNYHQVHQFVYLGGLITEDADITPDINRRTKIAWGCFRKFSTELFDRPNAPLRLKARLLKAEAMEALLYGCMTSAPRNAHYRQLRTTHHNKLLLRVIGYHRVHGTYRKMSYAKAVKKTGSQSVEATIRQRRLLFAGALARQGDKRLPKRLLFAERIEGGEDPGPDQPAQHWQKSLRDDSKAFGALHGSTPTDRRTFGVDRLVWADAARKGEGVPWYTGADDEHSEDSFLFIYFIFYLYQVLVLLYTVYFVCDSASEFGAMGSISFLGFSYPNLLLVFLNLLFLGTCIIFISQVLNFLWVFFILSLFFCTLFLG